NFDRCHANFALASGAWEVTPFPMFIASDKMTSPSVEQIPAGINAVEGYKASMNGDGLCIREHLPQIIERGAEALTPAEKELLKWIGVFFRKPTPGKFMMRIRMPNGFARSEQLHTIAELSRRLGNSVLEITTRQQIELRGFTLDSVDRKSTRLNSSHDQISYAVFCLKKKNTNNNSYQR